MSFLTYSSCNSYFTCSYTIYSTIFYSRNVQITWIPFNLFRIHISHRKLTLSTFNNSHFLLINDFNKLMNCNITCIILLINRCSNSHFSCFFRMNCTIIYSCNCLIRSCPFNLLIFIVINRKTIIRFFIHFNLSFT